MTEVLFVLVGLVIGVTVTYAIFSTRSTSGTLKIDHSNPDKDVFRFEIDDLDKMNKTSVRLKIDHNADLSQK